MRGRSALFVAFTTVLLLAGCGASSSHRAAPPTGAALAAAIRAANPGGNLPSKLKVSCHGHACTIAWNDLLDATNGWAVVLPTVVEAATDPRLQSMRHLNVRIYDGRDRRVATFSCDPRITRGSAPWKSNSPREKVAGCLETDRRLG